MNTFVQSHKQKQHGNHIKAIWPANTYLVELRFYAPPDTKYVISLGDVLPDNLLA